MDHRVLLEGVTWLSDADIEAAGGPSGGTPWLTRDLSRAQDEVVGSRLSGRQPAMQGK
jgi:hypothetical protein